MKSSIFTLLAALLLLGSTGCAGGPGSKKGCRDGCNGNCNQCGLATNYDNGVTAHGDPCGRGGGGPMAGGHQNMNPRAFAGPSGPPTAAITYPYYTTRGPRDFLQDNPRTIGP
jgi:hypothetical protein